MKGIIYCFSAVCLLLLHTEGKGQVRDSDIKNAKQTAISARGNQRFIDNDSVHWLWGGDASLSFTATGLSNWAGGGEDQIGVRPTVNLFANYKKGKRTFENFATFGFGVLKTGERKAVKNDDRLHYTSKAGHQISPKWSYTVAFLLRTQFAPGYRYSGEHITAKLSDFLAPVNMYLSAGLDYQPHKSISCMVSPVMGRAIFVRSDSSTVIAGAGLMTTEKDAAGKNIQVPHHSRYEFGGGALIRLNGNLFKSKLTYSSQVELFSNYMEDPQNVDVFWTLTSRIMIYKNITADLRLDLIYDDNQKTKDPETNELKGAKVQIKNFVGVGLYYQF